MSRTIKNILITTINKGDLLIFNADHSEFNVILNMSFEDAARRGASLTPHIKVTWLILCSGSCPRVETYFYSYNDIFYNVLHHVSMSEHGDE